LLQHGLVISGIRQARIEKDKRTGTKICIKRENKEPPERNIALDFQKKTKKVTKMTATKYRAEIMISLEKLVRSIPDRPMYR